DLAGNMTVSNPIIINVKNIITLQGYEDKVTLYPQHGDTINLNNYTPDIPEKMDFAGWYSDHTYTTKVSNIVVGDKPVTVYAYYTHAANTITFDPNGGEVNINNINVPHGMTSNYL